MALLDAFQNYTASAGRQYRGIKRVVLSGATTLTGFAPYVPAHLLSSPIDLQTGDAALAKEFYQGRFMLAGRILDIKGNSPFSRQVEKSAPSQEWLNKLHSFEWLRHFSASDDALSASYAAALVREWIEKGSQQNRDLVWEVETASRRLIAWLQNSLILLSVQDKDFHQMLMRSLGAHVRFLKRHAGGATEGLPQLMSSIALGYASACFSVNGKSLDFATQRLGVDLDRQVLPDGSHISRNPQTVLEILTYLLPLKETLVAAGKTPPEQLIPAIERLLQGLRFFRLGDGNLARFNGSGNTESGLISSVQRYDENLKQQELNASIGGYERLQQGNTIVLMDAGNSPKGEMSMKAHAGCLSMEFSSGSDCIVVNAGKPLSVLPDMPAVWRSTAAHSTAVFYNTSSSKFENSGAENGLLDGQMFGSALKSEASRTENEHGISVNAHHMGYVREFGARYQRILTLDSGGARLRGNDWFSGPDKGDLYYTTKDAVSIHFHLHPAVVAKFIEDGNAILLGTRSGQSWRFECDEVTPTLEESIFFASFSGVSKTQQIVLHFKACRIPEINWSFIRQ